MKLAGHGQIIALFKNIHGESNYTGIKIEYKSRSEQDRSEASMHYSLNLWTDL
jgi:hypothetical protein